MDSVSVKIILCIAIIGITYSVGHFMGARMMFNRFFSVSNTQRKEDIDSLKILVHLFEEQFTEEIPKSGEYNENEFTVIETLDGKDRVIMPKSNYSEYKKMLSILELIEEDEINNI